MQRWTQNYEPTLSDVITTKYSFTGCNMSLNIYIYPRKIIHESKIFVDRNKFNLKELCKMDAKVGAPLVRK